MSHIHIPDGVLPIGWWLAGYIVVAILLSIALRRVEQSDLRKKVPYLGVISALMLITMSVPVGGLPFHVNLTVLIGILAGPWLGIISVFIVNLFLAFFGHGGITVVGVNTLILSLELVGGWAIFKLIRKFAKDSSAVAVATVVALLFSTVAMFGVIGLSQVSWEYALPHDHNYEDSHDHAELASPLEIDTHSDEEHDHEEVAAVMTRRASNDDEHTEPENAGTSTKTTAQSDEHDEVVSNTQGTVAHEDEPHDQNGHADEEHQGSHLSKLTEIVEEISFLNMSGILAVLVILIVGITLETLVTVFIVNFFKKVRPDLLD